MNGFTTTSTLSEMINKFKYKKKKKKKKNNRKKK
jgi:hypothetical protein